MLTKTINGLIFEPKSFFGEDAGDMPSSLPFLFLILTLILNALGFWLVARGVVLGQWNFRFDLILLGLAGLVVIWLAFTLTVWLVARILRVKLGLWRLVKACAYASMPFAVAWVPALLAATAKTGAWSIVVKIFIWLCLAFLLNLALRALSAAVKAGYVPVERGKSEANVSRRFGIAMAVPVLAGLAILGIGWGLRYHGNPYMIKGNIIFGQAENWAVSSQSDTMLLLTDTQSPEGVIQTRMAVEVDPLQEGDSIDAFFNAFYTDQTGATLVSSEDLSLQGMRAKRGVILLQQGEVSIVLTLTVGDHGKYMVFLAGEALGADAARAAGRFQAIYNALKPYEHKLHVSMPGLIDWNYYF